MTVSYVHSPSFSAHTAASPPQSPLVSSASFPSSSSPVIEVSSPRAASRALGASVTAAAASGSAPAVHQLATSSSAPVLADPLTGANSIVVRNERMEAGLSLRRSPLIPTAEFAADPRTPDSSLTLVDDLESADARYEPAFTGDIDLHDRYVYRRPYVDRGLSHTKRRSQLILEQKYHQHRLTSSPGASPNEQELFKTPAVPRSRSQSSKRPGTAPPPESSASRTIVTSPAGLRELTTGAAAQPASKRASWVRRTRDFETRSDSHHPHTSGLLEPAAPITASTKASRRHSSFLAGDYRSATLMPILASNTFDARPPKHPKRRSYRSDKSASPVSNVSTSSALVSSSSSGLVGAVGSKRDSMLSTDSSATSSSKDGSHSVDHVEFEGDDLKQQAQSSASSGCGHDDTAAGDPEKWRPRSATTDSKLEVYTTPRSSADHEEGGAKSTVNPLSEMVGSKTTQPANESYHEAVEVVQDDAAQPQSGAESSSADPELVAAPAIPSAVISSVETAIVPPTPTAPAWQPRETDAVSPSSSPSAGFKPLHAADEPISSPKSPFGTLAVPQGRANGNGRGAGRRDSSTSIASAASSTSTYRIRRKAVPSDVDPSERRPSVTSGAGSDAGEFSPQASPASELAPLPPPKDKGVHGVSVPRDPSGAAFMRMAQEASQAHMLEKSANGTGTRQRPSTAAAAAATPGALGLGIVQQPQAGASSRDVPADSQLTAGATPTATRTPSRATIKRPTTVPVASGDPFRAVSDAQKSVLEVEGQQFVLGKEEAAKPKPAPDSSPSIPNAVRFMQHQRVGSNGTNATGLTKRDSQKSAKQGSNAVGANRRGSASTDSAVRANGATANTAPSKAGSWGLEQELQIVDRVRNGNGDAQKKGAAPRPESLQKGKNDLLFENEDESEDVKAAAREAGIPEGSYAIHPPSMLQLFEASQCLVYNQNGEEVLFGDLFKKRRTLVCFLRHWWCGFCQQFAMSVRNIDPLPLKKANLDFVIVGQGDWHVIKAYREVMQVQYPMFADPKRNVYRALGMTLRTNDANPACARPDYASISMTKGFLVAIKKGLFDMPIRNPGDMKLLGGDLILGPGLQCSFTHRMTTADGHMDIPRILAQAGCDLSLKTPKPMFTLDEKEARSAMLAGGNSNRRPARSLGRSRGKKASKPDAATMDTSFGSAAGAAMAGSMSASSSNARFARPSLWGHFPGRFSKSQVSLDQTASMADLSHDFSPARGLAAGPRSASAMRKMSYDGRVRESFETQQTDIEFESRATSFDTRERPSDVSAPGGLGGLNKVQSMPELRRRFEMGGLGSFRSKKEPAAGKLSLDVPGAGRERLQHSVSSKSLRGAQPNGVPTPKAVGSTGDKAVPTRSVFRNNVIAQTNGGSAVPAAAAATGLGIAAAGVEPVEGANHSGSSTAVVDASAPSAKATTAPAAASASLAAPGSFLTDLDVYDSLSAPPAQKPKPNGGDNTLLTPSIFDSGLSPSQFSDSDTEPAMSPARGERAAAASANSSPGSGGAALGPSASSSFYSFNTFRAKPLEHLVEEADEEADDLRDQMEHESGDEDEENDEPIEFEDGRSGGF
ncbi:conserved hypothetical protein [Sporisorium reilianum SRZ2]|uniref:Thioredoxin domain-containing protein n=1 Tax=Sporisorium reilianum (strain SRZ2) TaxID=999809 RepID=E6ZN25_SPORE|nr:conserved hypothetical protein [Sporisorium reilianum SRZ2]